MEIQVVAGVIGTVAGVVSAYYGYLQYKRNGGDPISSDTSRSSGAQKDSKLWSQAVDRSLETFRKTRKDCDIEIVEQKNFDKPLERFSTSELVLYVRYRESSEPLFTYRFALKINKEGDILEMESKGKRVHDNERFS